MPDIRKAQVVHYKCCNGQFAACVEPHCYSDPDWMKDLRKYAKQGYRISVIELGNGKMFDHENGCPNAGTDRDELPKESKNQLQLFR